MTTTSSVSVSASATVTARELLVRAMSADETTRTEGERGLREMKKTFPGCGMPTLLEIGASRTESDVGVRLLAFSVLKRGCNAKSLSKLSMNDKAGFQRELLDAVMREGTSNVRNAIMDVIARVARLTVPLGHWPELLEFLGQCASSPEPAHRVLAFKMFATLTETIVGALSHHFGTLAQLFSSGLVDSIVEVRVSALRAVGALACNSEPGDSEQSGIIKSLVPHVLEAAKSAVANGDEDSATVVFEVLDELCMNSTSALSGQIPAVVSFCVEVAMAEQHLSTLARRRALDVLAYLARHKPKALTKSKLIAPILSVVCPLCGEPKEAELAGEDDVDEEEEEQMEIQTVASQLIDILALKIPAKHILPTVLSFASTNVNSDNERLRHAAVAVLGVVTEGCAEGVRAHSGTIIPSVVEKLSDSNASIRGAAAFTLGQFAEHLSLTMEDPEMHKRVLPSLFNALPTEQVKSVQERMMYAMDAWLEDLEEEVGMYVKPLLDIVLLALDNGAKHHVREMLLSALASACASNGAMVHPYLNDLLPRLDKCLSHTADEELNIRARALEVLGMLISAEGGKQAMGPHVESAMKAGLSGFDLDFAELREYGHGLFGEVSEALGNDFTPYLDVCVQKAFESIELDDGIMFDSEDEADRQELDSDDEGDHDEDGMRKTPGYSIRSGVMDEKASACKALNCYATHCPNAFAPYISRAVELLDGMTEYMHEMVRVQAHLALAQCAIAALKVDPAAGAGAVELVNKSLSATILCVLQDEDRDSVAASIEASALLLKILKAHPVVKVDQHIIDLTAASLEVLEGRTFCQQEDEYDSEAGDEEDEEDEEDAEAGLVVIEAIAELLPALANYMGAEFAQHFAPHFNALMKRTGENHTETERSLCYATLVEVVRAVGAPAAMCAPVALPGCLRDTKSVDIGLRRNSAYCTGVLLMIGGEHAQQFHSAAAEALAPMTRAENESDGGVRDNAAGAIARLLLVIGSEHEDASKALLAVLLDALPLRHDLEEGPEVYHGLAATVGEAPASLEDDKLTRIIQVFAQVITESLAPADTLRILGAAMAQGANADARVQQVLGGLTAEQQAAIRAQM